MTLFRDRTALGFVSDASYGVLQSSYRLLEQSIGTKDKRILIVEDDSAICEVVRKYFEVEGFIVLEAINGPLALMVLHEQAIDLVILDIMLPGLDGFAITCAVREPLSPQQMTTSSSVPIIALTARGDEAVKLGVR